MRYALQIALSANPAQMVKGFSQAETSVQKFAVAFETAQNVAKATGQALNAAADEAKRAGVKMVAWGVGTGAAIAGATVKAIQFQAAMKNVETITDPSVSSIGRMSKAVLDLSRNLPQSANELAQGLYDIVSSGQQGSDALEVLRVSGMAASAGLSNTATAARAVSAVLNAYGLDASNAENVSDILFQTVNLGVVSFEELTQSVGEWVGMAAAANVKAEEAAAAISAMTLAGLGADEAATSLSRLMQAFIQPSDAMNALVKDLGHESAMAMLSTEGLGGSMEELRLATGGNVEQLVRLFPEIRAARGAFALMAGEGKNFANSLDKIADQEGRAGATQKAFNKQMEGVGQRLTLLKNETAAFAIEIGSTLLPVLGLVVEFLKNVVHAADTITDIPGMKAMIATGTVLGSILLMLIGYFALMHIRQAVTAVVMQAVSNRMNALAASTTNATVAARAQNVANAANIFSLNKVQRTAKLAEIGMSRLSSVTSLASKAMGIAGIALTAYTLYLAFFHRDQKDADQSTKELTKDLLDQAGALDKVGKKFLETRFTDKNQVDDLRRMGMSLDDVDQLIRRGKDGLNEFTIAAERSGEISLNKANKMTSSFSSVADAIDHYGSVEDAVSNRAIIGNTGILNTFADIVLAEQDASKAAMDRFVVQGTLTESMVAGAEASNKNKQGVIDYSGALMSLEPQIRDSIARQHGLADGSKLASMSMDDLSDAVQKAEAAQTALQQRIDAVARSITSFLDPLGIYAAAISDATDLEREHSQALADSTKSDKDSWQDYFDTVSVGLDDLATRLEKQIQAQINFNNNVKTLAAQGFGDVAQDLLSRGAEVAGAITQKLVDAGPNDPGFQRWMAAYQQSLPDATTQMSKDLEKELDIITTIISSKGKTWAEELARQFATGVPEILRIAAQYGLQISSNVHGVRDPQARNFASGGVENHQAQIADPKSVRIWAEPETGGEAYIPLAQSKRKRSTMIWAQTGHLLGIQGFLGGGIISDKLRALPGAQGQAGGIRSWPDLLTRGNIDLTHRPLVKNPDGSTSTVRSIGVDDDRGSWLLPTVLPSPTPHVGNNTEAVGWWRSTGQHLGLFRSDNSAESYAQYLHQKQSSYYHLANGGILGASSFAGGGLSGMTGPFRPSSSKGSGAGTTTSKDTITGALFGGLGSAVPKDVEDRAKEIAQNLKEAQLEALGGQELLDELDRMIAAETAYTDAWVTLTDRRKKAEEDIGSFISELVKHQEDLYRNRYEMGFVSDDEWMAHLQDVLQNTEEFSSEWRSAQEEIISMLDKAAQKRQALEDNQFEAGIISNVQYLGILDDRLANEEKYSDAYFQILRTRNTVAQALWEENHKNSEEQISRIADLYVSAGQKFRAQQEAYQQAVNSARDKVVGELTSVWEKASSEQQKQMDAYQAVVDARVEAIKTAMANYKAAVSNPVKELANIVGVFGQRLSQPGADEISAMLEHRTEAATRWSETMQRLSTKGFDEDLMNQLASAGPEALGLAETLDSMDPAKLNEAIKRLHDLGTSLGDVLGTRRQAQIEATVIADNPLPAMEEFNTILEREKGLWVENNAQQDRARSWAESMSGSYMPSINFQWKTFNQLLQEEMSDQKLADEERKKGLEWARGMIENELPGLQGGYGGVTQSVRDLIAAMEDLRREQDRSKTPVGGGTSNGGLSQEFLDLYGQLSPYDREIVDALGRTPANSYDQGGYLPTGLSLSYNGTGGPERVGGPQQSLSIQVSAPVTVGSGTSLLGVERAVEQGVNNALGKVVSRLQQGVRR